MTPQRIQLRRTKGFDLQAISRALNGLPAVNCARPWKFGNPFVVGESYELVEIYSPAIAARLYRNWLKETDQRDLIGAMKRELPGHNLACWCAADSPDCHLIPILEILSNA